MIKLRVVGTSPENDELLLSNKPRGKRASHAVQIDKKLFDVLQDAVYARREAQIQERRDRRAAAAAPAEPRVPPREIQRLLRGGLSTGQVAKQADVPEAYVEQFLTPVLYERRGVVADAQTVRLEKPRKGESALALGDAVAENLVSRRVRMSDESAANAWTATRHEGHPWVVTFTFPFRGRARTARWRFDQRARTLEAANKLASDIGWVPNGKRRPPAPVAAPARARKTTARKTTARKTTARKTTARKTTARKTTARKTTARKTTARKTPARKTTARKTTARKTPARKTTARKTPARKTTARKTTARKTPARKTPARKTTARKTTARKTTARKTTARKTPARKTTARKTTARRSVPRRQTATRAKTKRRTTTRPKPVRRGVRKRAQARRSTRRRR